MTEPFINNVKFSGVTYPRSLETKGFESLPRFTGGDYDVVPFPVNPAPSVAEDRQQLIAIAVQEEVGTLAEVYALLHKADAVMTGIWSSSFGLGQRVPYTLFVQEFGGQDQTKLETGSVVHWRHNGKEKDLLMVRDIDGTEYICDGWDGGPGQIIAKVIHSLSGQIEMAVDVDQADEPYLKKAAAALAMTHSMALQGNMVTLSGKELDERWHVNIIAERYKHDQGNHDSHRLNIKAFRQFAT